MGRPVKQDKFHIDVITSINRLLEASEKSRLSETEEEKEKWGKVFDIRNVTLEEAIRRLKEHMKKEFKFTYYDNKGKSKRVIVKTRTK